MGNFKRINLPDIEAMQRTLDTLPDKKLGKTRDEAAELLNANMLKALEKGYSVKELSEIMSQGNVDIPLRVLRKKLTSSEKSVQGQEVKPKVAKVKEVQESKPKQANHLGRDYDELPDYYTPDKPDSEL